MSLFPTFWIWLYSYQETIAGEALKDSDVKDFLDQFVMFFMKERQVATYFK